MWLAWTDAATNSKTFFCTSMFVFQNNCIKYSCQNEAIRLQSYGVYIYFKYPGSSSKKVMEECDDCQLFFEDKSFTVLTQPMIVTRGKQSHAKIVCDH